MHPLIVNCICPSLDTHHRRNCAYFRCPKNERQCRNTPPPPIPHWHGSIALLLQGIIYPLEKLQCSSAMNKTSEILLECLSHRWQPWSLWYGGRQLRVPWKSVHILDPGDTSDDVLVNLTLLNAAQDTVHSFTCTAPGWVGHGTQHCFQEKDFPFPSHPHMSFIIISWCYHKDLPVILSVMHTLWSTRHLLFLKNASVGPQVAETIYEHRRNSL